MSPPLCQLSYPAEKQRGGQYGTRRQLSTDDLAAGRRRRQLIGAVRGALGTANWMNAPSPMTVCHTIFSPAVWG